MGNPVNPEKWRDDNDDSEDMSTFAKAILTLVALAILAAVVWGAIQGADSPFLRG